MTTEQQLVVAKIKMNPAVLNYLQSQQQPNQNMEQAPQQQAPYNPFDSGINKAISSARDSLGMTDKQQEKALRRSMLTFGDNIAQQPKQKGFWNNFGSVGRALSPAIMAHDDAEDAAVTQNNALANQMLAYQAAEQKRQEDAKQQTWERQHKEALLGEQRRSHNLMDNFRRDQLSNRADLEGSKIENAAWIHREKHNATKYIPEIAAQYEKNQELLPTINEFRDLLSSSNLAGGSKLASLKRFIAQQTGYDEDILNANNMGQFYLEWMNANSKGALSDRDIKVYSAGFADIEKNPKASIKILNRLEKKLQDQQELNTLKLDMYEQDPGANLTRVNILNKNMRGAVKSKPQVPIGSATNQGDTIKQEGSLAPTVSFFNPDTGKYFDVPSDVAEAVQEQYPNLVMQ
jgi:hypothetical protein